MNMSLQKLVCFGEMLHNKIFKGMKKKQESDEKLEHTKIEKKEKRYK